MRTAQAKTKWLDTPSSEWTVSLAKKLLAELEGDDQFKIEAVLGTRVYDPAAQLALLDAALSATERSLSQYTSPKSSHSAYNLACNAAVNQDYVDELRQVLEDNAAAVKLLEQRYRLLELQDKTRTWQEIYGSNASPVASGSGSPSSQDQDAASPSSQEQNEMQGSEEHDSVVEESWQFDEDEAQTDLVDADLLINTDEALPADKASDNTCLLPDFLDTSVEESAFSAAANNEIDILRTLFTRHARQLNPLRLDVLDTVPLFSDVTEYTDLLPKFDPSRKVEVLQEGRAWRTDSNEWKSEPIVRNSLGLAPEYPTWTPSSAERLADWYQRRIRELDEVTGQVDNALSLVQYGAAQDLPGLDALGEQLSLLSRLVYDRRSAGSAHANQQAWSLKKWQSSSEADIVDAYLSQSTPETIVQDIRGQVLPYLYVLESQRERAGKPDPKLHDTLLFDWMLRSAESPSPANLETIAAIFDASKPTLPAVQRIVRSDEDLARLALACCYGHPGVSARGVQAMLRIFDCLPSFEESAAPSPPRDTDSLLAVVRSTASAAKGDKLLSSTDLWAKMKLWSASALSRALDTLDLHLEAAEIFQRWSAPVALQSFILLSADEKGQRLWADRLAKTSPAAVAHLESQERIGRDFEDEDEWISLLDDLCKLGGKAAYTGSDPRPAFSALSQQDITKIFFGGLLSSASM